LGEASASPSLSLLLLSRRDNGKAERLGSSTHPGIVGDHGGKIRPEAESSSQVMMTAA